MDCSGETLTTEISDEGGSPVLAVRGEVDFLSAPQLAASLDELVGASPRRLLVDLAGTTFMDCAGARVIAEARLALPRGASSCCGARAGWCAWSSR